MLQGLAGRPYKPQDVVGLWAHLLDSLTFLEGTLGKRPKELRSSQVVALQMMTRTSDLLIKAMKGRFLPFGRRRRATEKARAQQVRGLELASRAMRFRRFADP